MFRTLCSVVIVIAVASTAFALKCKVCESENDNNCAENFPSGDRHVINCNLLDKSKNGCVKITAPKENNNKIEELHRYCVWDVKPNSAAYWDEKLNLTAHCQNYEKFAYKGDLKFLNCKLCPTDFCESAGNRGVLAAILLFFILVPIMS